ncbi:MAG: SDR family oxidoreductase [Candidatus Kapabacteria bacterium]|nr:SDR family oxidoreductase [Candidatus Kapabacteria bacterium]
MATMLITGAAGGLGSVVTEYMLEKEWTVFTLDREDGDISSSSDVERMMSTIPTDVSAVVHLVGGIVAGKPLEETTLVEFQNMVSINVAPAFNILRAMIPRFKALGSGAIVTIGAQSVVHPVANRAAYASSKAAVVALTQAVAEEGRLFSIRANCILPGTIRTPANLEWATGTMADNWILPEQIAETIHHLCLPTCGISGAVIPMYAREVF